MRQAFALAIALMGSVVAAHSQDAIRNRSVRIIEGAPPAAAVPAHPTTIPVLSDVEQRANNPSGLKVDLLPGGQLTVGDKMALKVSTEKPGFLVVVDVDSSGKLTQIFPNTQSLADPKGASEKANRLTRGKLKVIPDPREKSNFDFVAAPPLGVGMVVAILSDKPVQMIDLPDVPASVAGLAPALAFVQETTRTLKILPASDSGRIEEPNWSFATQFYVIK
jgi:hypothetical protein